MNAGSADYVNQPDQYRICVWCCEEFANDADFKAHARQPCPAAPTEEEQ